MPSKTRLRINRNNTVLTKTTINQYFLHARILQHWGVSKLGKFEYKEPIDEMTHADEVVQWILFLGGLPNLQRLNQVAVGETFNEILKAGLDLEEKALVGLRETIAYSENVRDFVSPDLADRILRSEEERVDFLDRQSTSSNW